MKKNQFNAVAAAVVLMTTVSFSSQAQVQPADSAAVPNQQGVVYPGRAVEMPLSATSVEKNPIGVGAYAPANAIPAPGTPLPAQARQAAPGREGMPTGIGGQIPIGSPALGSVQRPVSQGAPAMPPLPGATAGKGSESTKTAQELAIEDTLPQNIDVQVRELRRRMDEVQRAASANPAPAPKPVTRSISITQAAGEEPQSVRTAMGMPTNLVFTDASGASWPIAFATPGDMSQFDVVLPVAGTSTIQIRPKTPYAYGGLSITLKDNDIPVSVILTAAQKEVDNRVDVRVMQRGPNAVAPIVDRVVTGGSAASDHALISFLDGVPPAGAKEMRTSYRGVKAWILNDQMYLRTDSTLVSPLWTDSLSSPSGVTRTYLLSNVPSVIISAEGRMVPVTISE